MLSWEEAGLEEDKDITGVGQSERSSDRDLVQRAVALSKDKPDLGTWATSTGAFLLMSQPMTRRAGDRKDPSWKSCWVEEDMSHPTRKNVGLLPARHLCSGTHPVAVITLYWFPPTCEFSLPGPSFLSIGPVP